MYFHKIFLGDGFSLYRNFEEAFFSVSKSRSILVIHLMVGPLGLRRLSLPYVGKDCVTSRKNVCVEAGWL